ncbi:MAG: peptidoglycan DD-metalloendopeptidase family protein [Clostridiales bacterium]|nr:peptidoglycan DD-metalloendopeptidase family protein [Roseburia sp.]MDD7636082.1 peptidoglycan DD-metalloendopeptidase family protein [Clostridiales bacterium]MDY4112568.1 peptidoglycan DD-metalloendopeptidase family protein [Roseburia sp.]
MKSIEFTKKAKIQAIAVGVAAVVLLLLCVMQMFGIGQVYQCVSVNGNLIGYTSTQTDVKEVIQMARREISMETGERLSIELNWESSRSRKPFQKLMSEGELKDSVKGMITEEEMLGKQRAYTVAIDGYRANFTSLEEVETFLNRVKESVDEVGEYETRILGTDQHISGIMNAVLVSVQPEETIEIIPEETMADILSSGAQSDLVYAMEYAFSNPSDGSYQTGILDMEFVEKVEIYENFIDAEEISDIEEQVVEVTKEKESNKIYVVESGDCLSVIAMDHDTTVASIVALNGFSSADQMIRDGQELIIAVPEPDLQIRITMGEVYEEDYTAEPIIIENDSWYTTKEVVHDEGTTGHRERNDVVVYENGIEVSREMIHENVMIQSEPAVIERGTIVPPTYIKPLSGGRYTSGFGRRWGRMHKGVDWACPIGTTVYASCGGTVIQASYSGGYGNCVVISHPDGRMTRYAHNSKLLVSAGQHVEQGQPIALSGSTGRSTGPHVHFELYINGSAVNPLKYISY